MDLEVELRFRPVYFQLAHAIQRRCALQNPIVKSPSILLKIVIPLLAAKICTAAAAAPDVHTLAQRVDDRYNHLKTLQAEFTELYRGAGMERTESGTLWLKKPGKMRWEYRSPKEKLFLSDGREAWFYLPGDRQARRTPVKKLDDLRSPLAFLLGKTKLEKELQGLSFAPDISPATPGNLVLRGVPKAMADRVSQVLLEINPQDQIARIVIEEVEGSVTEYRFDQQKENLEISDQRFRFDPPAGVEVVEAEFGP
jgi:outer membrane lipoprotein carrier protein